MGLLAAEVKRKKNEKEKEVGNKCRFQVLMLLIAIFQLDLTHTQGVVMPVRIVMSG